MNQTIPRSRNWTRTSEERLREELLHRFEKAGPMTRSMAFKYHSKRLAWRWVVDGTLAVKRAFDIFVSLTCLLLASPVFGLLALLIRLDSPGPIFFKQVRVGKQGRLFNMYKFRSMYVDAEERKKALMQANEMSGGVIFKMKNDPRVTRVGKYIRKLSLDELPQIWNVLRGDMSLVGPRPPVPQEVEQYTLEDRRRLEVIPGITCIWQVSGRSNIPFKEQVKLDVAYIENQTFWGDIQLLLRTIPAVFLGHGAY